jgi:hypothetical protein
MPGSHLGLDTVRGFSYFIFEPSKIMSVKQNNLNYATAASFHTPSNSLSPLLSNRRCMFLLTGPLITSKYTVFQTIYGYAILQF